jgi:hypothetical protein
MSFDWLDDFVLINISPHAQIFAPDEIGSLILTFNETKGFDLRERFFLSSLKHTSLFNKMPETGAENDREKREKWYFFGNRKSPDESKGVLFIYISFADAIFLPSSLFLPILF